jgi:hypothetical protein
MNIDSINEFNFIKGSEKDRDLFFGPIDWNMNIHLEKMGAVPERDVLVPLTETFIEIEDNWIMANIMFVVGLFPSVTQARKNGYNTPIPSGFTDMRVGKKKTRVTIFFEK